MIRNERLSVLSSYISVLRTNNEPNREHARLCIENDPLSEEEISYILDDVFPPGDFDRKKPVTSSRSRRVGESGYINLIEDTQPKTVYQAKELAKLLRQRIKDEFGIDKKHSECLEMISHRFHFKDWNVFCHKLKKEESVYP